MNDEYKIIRDSIHGDIKLDGLFLELSETPTFQRLHNIRQLGFAHLVFPGAHHTRLEHSLGVYKMAFTAADSLNLDQNEKMLLACAALLHDLGHGPFSHTLEFLLRNEFGVDHVDLTEKLILGDYEISSSAEKKVFDFVDIVDILSKYDIQPKKIVDIIRGKPRGNAYLSQLLNSPVDVDQLDYLMRDAYYTGVAYGMIDVGRLMNTLVIHDNILCVKQKGISAIENILMARGLMYSSVYFHKTVRIAELMLSKAIESASGKDPFEFFKMTDSELIEELKNKGDFQYKIITRLKYRKLFKQAYSLSPTMLDINKKGVIQKLENNLDFKKEKEQEIEQKLNIPNGHVIIDVPSQELYLSEPRIDKVNIQIIDEERNVKTLSDFTPVADAVKSRVIPDWIVMIVTDEKYRSSVSNKAEKILFD